MLRIIQEQKSLESKKKGEFSRNCSKSKVYIHPEKFNTGLNFILCHLFPKSTQTLRHAHTCIES